MLTPQEFQKIVNTKTMPISLPLVKALQTELGEERANAIIRKALSAWMRKASEEMSKHLPDAAIDKPTAMLALFSAGDAMTLKW